MFKNHRWLFCKSGLQHRHDAGLSSGRPAVRAMSCLAMIVVGSCVVSQALGDLLVPDGLNPGDTYHLVFNSSQRIQATSSDIMTYNNLVQSTADAAGIGASEGVTWSAIASTPSIHARDNAVVGLETPVFNMNLDLVATGFDDIWDGSVSRPINLDELGRSNTVDPWTGTNANGTAASGLALGQSGSAWCGSPGSTNSRWIHNQTPPASQYRPLYALSQELMVPYLSVDYNTDGLVDVTDVDSLLGAINRGENNESFDLTGDGVVDKSDLTAWRSAAAEANGYSAAYLPGDTNLDGRVNSIDLNNLALNWRQNASGWSAGDFAGDGKVDALDLNELALNWRSFTPVTGTVPVFADSDAYVQKFDEALGMDGATTGTALPTGWKVADNGMVGDTTMRAFPIDSTMTGSNSTTSSYNAGGQDDPDRALAVGVKGAEDELSLQLTAHSAGAPASSFQLQFDVEAWDAVDGIKIGNNVIAGPESPGEAAFKLTVDIDSGDGFTQLVELGTITTGPKLHPVFDGIVDGNDDSNRVSFDSGIVTADIPADAKVRFRWAPDFDAPTDGWVFGLDNVSLSLYSGSNAAMAGPVSVPEPAGMVSAAIALLSICLRRPRSKLATEPNV